MMVAEERIDGFMPFWNEEQTALPKIQNWFTEPISYDSNRCSPLASELLTKPNIKSCFLLCHDFPWELSKRTWLYEAYLCKAFCKRKKEKQKQKQKPLQCIAVFHFLQETSIIFFLVSRQKISLLQDSRNVKVIATLIKFVTDIRRTSMKV